MAPTLYRDIGYSLTHLIEDIKHGNIALPDIQRPFVWSSAKVRDLFDSMYRGYPVGTLMLWETGSEVGTRQIGESTNVVPRLLIVDGQQRLTSLYAVMTGQKVLTKKFEEKKIRIAFRPNDETFAVTDAAIEKDPEFIPDITVLWAGGYRSVVREFEARLEAARDCELTHEEQDVLEDRIDGVRDLRDFRFQVIELSTGADEEQVADIFVRINSEGVQLNQADFILTLMSVHWEEGRSQLEVFSRNAVDPAVTGPSPKNKYIQPSPDQLLRVAIGLAFRRGRLQHVYSILRGKDLQTGEYSTDRRTEQFQILETAQADVLNLTNWHEFLKCLARAGFRSRKMITSANAIIYAYTVFLIGKRDFGLDYRKLQSLISRWFFMTLTTGRYSSSPESIFESDLTRISALPQGDSEAFCNELERLIGANFTRDYWEITLPNKLDTSSSRSPVLYAYWAALNLLDAESLFGKVKIRDLLDPQVTAPRSIERHHLFPVKHLAGLGVTNKRLVNAIANMAFLDWPDNAKISADDPQSYWTEMTHHLSPEHIKQHSYWHALPVGWSQLDYPTFLKKRRALIAEVVKDGFATLAEENTSIQAPTLMDLIALGESNMLELKSTARWNVRAERQDKKMEHVIAKTVGGFFNAEGGKLLIGVSDDGEVLGLDADLKTLGSKADKDGYELWLRQMLDNSLSVPTAGLVHIGFENLRGQDICMVQVAPAARPVFSKPVEGNVPPCEFWVRIGNATKQLHGDDMVTYQDDHWG